MFLKENVFAFIWRDNRDVRMITNVDGYGMTLCPTRKDMLPKPNAILEYNEHTRGVDKGDQFSSYYMCDHRSLKWWRRVFINLVDISIMNAYIIFRSFTGSRITQSEYRQELIKQIILTNLSIRRPQAFLDIHTRLQNPA